MRELEPAYTKNKEVVFIEKINGDTCRAIKLDPHYGIPTRVNIDMSTLENWKAIRSETRIDELQIWFKITEGATVFAGVNDGGSNISSLFNAAVRCSTVLDHGNDILYKLRHNSRNYFFTLENLVYMPMVNTKISNIENYEVGKYAVALETICEHNLVKGTKYVIKSVLRDQSDMFYGTVYLEDPYTHMKITTYSKHLKLIKSE